MSYPVRQTKSSWLTTIHNHWFLQQTTYRTCTVQGVFGWSNYDWLVNINVLWTACQKTHRGYLRSRSDIFVRDVKVLHFQMIQLSTTLSLFLSLSLSLSLNWRIKLLASYAPPPPPPPAFSLSSCKFLFVTNRQISPSVRHITSTVSYSLAKTQN